MQPLSMGYAPTYKDYGVDQDNLVSESAPEVGTSVETQTEAPVSEANNEQVAGEQGVEKTYTQADVDRVVQERIARERRKAERRQQEVLHQYQQPQYQQPVHEQAYQQPVNQQQPGINPNELMGVVSQAVQQQRQFEQRQNMVTDFVQKVDQEAAKDPGFANFRDDMSDLCTDAMLEAAMYQKDPSVLYKMHKNDPEEFARIRSLAPAQQALMVAEYRGRLSAPSPKIVSDAPEPVSEP